MKKDQSIVLVEPEGGKAIRVTFLDFQEGYVPPGYPADSPPQPFLYRETSNFSGTERTFHLRGSCTSDFPQGVCGFLMDFLWAGEDWHGVYLVHSQDGVVRILYPAGWNIQKE